MGPKRPEIRKINDVNKNGDVEKAMDNAEQKLGKQIVGAMGPNATSSGAAQAPKKGRARKPGETADDYLKAAMKEGFEPQ